MKNHKNKPTEKNLRNSSTIPQIIILFTLLFIPIFFNLFGYEVFEVPKIRLFQFLTVCTLVATLLFTDIRHRLEYVKHKVLFASIALGIIVATTAMLTSPYRWTSFFGSYSRLMGWTTHLHFFVFFVLVFINFSSKDDSKKLLNVLMWGSIIPVTYGLLQILNTDFIGWNDASYGRRIFSTFGQPNFFAAYLLFIIPLTFYLYREGEKRSKVLLGMLTGQLLCLLFTGSRGGLLGFIAEVILFASLSGSRKIKNIVGIFTAILVSIIIVLTLIPSSFDVFEFNTRVPIGRQLIWQASLQAIAQRPLLGYGIDTVGYAIAPILTPDIITYEALNIPDRAHNILLDIAVTTGILGVLSFCFFIVILAKLLWKKIKENNTTAAMIAIALCGYLAQNLFNFDTSVSYLFAGIFVTLFLIEIYTCDQKTNCKKILLPRLLLIVPCILLLLFSAYRSFSPVVADMLYKSGLNIVNAPAKQSRTFFEQATAYNPYENGYLLAYVENLSADGNDLDAMQKIPKILAQVQRRETPNFLYYLALARYQAVQAQKEQSVPLIQQALENATTARKLAPYRIEALLLQANIYEVLGSNKEAIEALSYFLAITPKKYHKQEIVDQQKRLQGS